MLHSNHHFRKKSAYLGLLHCFFQPAMTNLSKGLSLKFLDMFHRYTCSFQYLGQFLPSKHLASMKVKLTCGGDGEPGGGIWQQGQYGGHDLLQSVIQKRKNTREGVCSKSSSICFWLFNAIGLIILEQLFQETEVVKYGHAFFPTKDLQVLFSGEACSLSEITWKVNTHDHVFLVLFEW